MQNWDKLSEHRANYSLWCGLARPKLSVKSMELSNAFTKDLVKLYHNYCFLGDVHMIVKSGIARFWLYKYLAQILTAPIQRSWSSEAATSTSFSGDLATYCSKTTTNFKLTHAWPHLTASTAVNAVKPQITFISDRFLSFTIFDNHVNVQDIDHAYITKRLYLYCSIHLDYNRTFLQFLLLAMSRVELQYFISASSSQPLILFK